MLPLLNVPLFIVVFEVSPGIITAYPLSIDTLVNSIIPLDILFSELWNVTFSKVAVPELFTDLTFEKIENFDGDVIATYDTHEDNYMETREGKFLPVPHCIKGTPGHDLYGRLADFEDVVTPNAVIIEKETFGSDRLCAVIEEAFSGEPDVIEFCGVVTNICVLSNVVLCQTYFKNAKIVVHEDATAAIGKQQDYAIEVLKGLGVEIV